MKRLVVLVLACITYRLYAQAPCGFDLLQRAGFTDQTAWINHSEAHNALLAERMPATEKSTGTVDTIEVVFHLMHTGEAVGTGTNISQAQVESAVLALNRDFGMLPIHDSIAITPYGDDMQFHFRLACADPNGQPTDGINRIDASLIPGYVSDGIRILNDATANFREVCSLSNWDPDRYVNVWLTHRITVPGGMINAGALPHPSPFFSDSTGGVYMQPNTTGSDPDETQGWGLQNKYGKLISHEVGHYLGLLHTFQGGSCTEVNCSTQGDGVCDTEPHDNSSPFPLDTTCNEFAECPTREPMENVMNYAAQHCGHAFTTGQKAKMEAHIALYMPTIKNPPHCPVMVQRDVEQTMTSLRIYPNPGSGVFRLVAQGFLPEIQRLEVQDAMGRHVISKSWRPEQGEARTLLDMQACAPGIYFVSVGSGRTRQTVRLLLQ